MGAKRTQATRGVAVWTDDEHGPHALRLPEEAAIRAIARAEIASLCGLVLRRVQDINMHPGPLRDELAEVFGEALRDFGATEDEPGPRAEDGGVAG